MTDNQRGFTLIELLAVVVIIGVIATIASTSTMGIIRRSREQTASDMRESLKDAAITYAIYAKTSSDPEDQEYKISKKCNILIKDDGGTVEEKQQYLKKNNCESSFIMPTVEHLKSVGFFIDDKGYCDGGENVLIYRYQEDAMNSEYKAFVNDNACKK